MKSDAIEELFRKYYNDALLYLISLTGNVAIAEEMVSTAFFKALKTADGAIKEFKPWLLKVCRNIFLSHCRAKKRYVELNENIPDRNESAIEKVIRNEDYRALYRAIGLLPEGQKRNPHFFKQAPDYRIRLCSGRRIRLQGIYAVGLFPLLFRVY